MHFFYGTFIVKILIWQFFAEMHFFYGTFIVKTLQKSVSIKIIKF